MWVHAAPDGTAIASWTQPRATGPGVEARYAVRGAAGRYGRPRMLVRGPSDEDVSGPVVAIANRGRGVLAAAAGGRIVAVRVPGGRPRRIARTRSTYSFLFPAVDTRGRGAVAWARGRFALVARLP